MQVNLTYLSTKKYFAPVLSWGPQVQIKISCDQKIKEKNIQQ